MAEARSSHASDHLRTCHLEEYEKILALDDKSNPGAGPAGSSGQRKGAARAALQTTLYQHKHWRGDTLERAHAYVTGEMVAWAVGGGRRLD